MKNDLRVKSDIDVAKSDLVEIRSGQGHCGDEAVRFVGRLTCQIDTWPFWTVRAELS